MCAGGGGGGGQAGEPGNRAGHACRWWRRQLRRRHGLAPQPPICCMNDTLCRHAQCCSDGLYVSARFAEAAAPTHRLAHLQPLQRQVLGPEQLLLPSTHAPGARARHGALLGRCLRQPGGKGGHRAPRHFIGLHRTHRSAPQAPGPAQEAVVAHALHNNAWLAHLLLLLWFVERDQVSEFRGTLVGIVGVPALRCYKNYSAKNGGSWRDQMHSIVHSIMPV